MCASIVTDKDLPSAICPTPQENAICSFIAATNIASISGYTMWSCTSDGITSTDPCSPVWSGIGCNGSSIVRWDLSSVGLAGTYYLGSISALYALFSTL